ncbi:MAG: CARDB domain-containing protein, partial [Candidatus Bathyarchaeia archaeon]
KRVVDWDANGYASDDVNFDWDPDHYLLKADDVTTGDSPRSFSYGITALYPRESVYDWDLYAWDDYLTIDHGSSYVPDGPVDGDYNVALYYSIGPLMPGERKEIGFAYGVGEGATPAESNANLIERLGGRMEVDAPWLSEKPTTGVVAPSDHQKVDVTFDTRGLDPGTYYAVVVVESNDPMNPVAVLPVVLKVRPGKPVIEDPAEGKSPDIVAVYEQLTEDAIILTTELAKPPSYPMVVITSLDTDGKAETGARNRYTNDIGADYMLYSMIGGDSPLSLKSYDFSTYKAAFPGVKFDSMSWGYYYLYKWEKASNTWTNIFSSGVGVEGDTLFHFWVPLVLMVSDGDMSVVQCAGNPMKIIDWAPDTGHGKTMPLRNIDVSGLWIDEASGWTELPVEIHTIVKNEGEKPETFTVEFYAKKTGAAPTAKPTAALPAPPTTPFDTESVYLEPNTQTSVIITYTTPTSGTYEIKALVPPVGKETNSTDNQRVISYGIKASHDLAATAITTTPEPYLKQPDAKVLVTIVNQGVVAEAGKQVEVKVNDKVIGTITFSCGVGETVVVQAPWVPDKLGAATLKATIKTIAGEDDVADNVVTGTATVINGHDIKVDSITVVNADPAKTKIEYGDDANVTAVVKNIGGVPEANVTVDFYVDGVLEDTQVIAASAIAPTGSATAKFTYNIAKLGDRKVKIVATPKTGMLTDINSKDNILEKIFKAEGVDIAVKSITTTPALNPKKGTYVTIKVVLENRGSSKVSTASLSIKVLGAGDVEEKSFAKTNIFIDVGKTATITMSTWKPMTSGSRTIRAEVTMGGDAIPENNLLTLPVVIIDRTWRLVPTAGTNVKLNSLQTITFRICDAAGNPVRLEGVVINLSAAGVKFGQARVTTNALGEATVTYTPLRVGNAKIIARAQGTDIPSVINIAISK